MFAAPLSSHAYWLMTLSWDSRFSMSSLCSLTFDSFSLLKTSASCSISNCSCMAACYRRLLLEGFKMWTPRPLTPAVVRWVKSRIQNFQKSECKLTTDVVRATKGGGDFGIELNHEIVLFSEVIVAVLDLIGNPLSEVVSNNRIYHVDDPLPW